MRILRAAVLGGVLAIACHSKRPVPPPPGSSAPSASLQTHPIKPPPVASTPEARWQAVQPILDEREDVQGEFRALRRQIEDHESACLAGKQRGTRVCVERSVAAHKDSFYADGECIDSPLESCARERDAFQKQELAWRVVHIAAAAADYPAHTDPDKYEDVYADPESEQRAGRLTIVRERIDSFFPGSGFSSAHQTPADIFKHEMTAYARDRETALTTPGPGSSGESFGQSPADPVIVRALFKIIDGIFSVLNTVVITFLAITAALSVIGVGAVLGWHTNDLYRDGTITRIWDSENARVQRPVLKYLRAAGQIFLQVVSRAADRLVALLASSETPNSPSSPPTT